MKKRFGDFTLVIGKMFDGKTEELIAEAQVRVKYTEQCVIFFKPIQDNREEKNKIASHNGTIHDVIAVDSPEAILKHIKIPESAEGCTIVIDEIQFFRHSIIAVINKLINTGYNVIAAGLAIDFLGRPFGATLWLIPYATEIIILNRARCQYKNGSGKICGKKAMFNQRVGGGHSLIETGRSESYEPRCREHWEPGGDEKDLWSWTENPASLFENYSVAVAVCS